MAEGEVMSQQITIVLHFDQCVLVKQRRVMLSDVASIYGTEQVMQQKIGELELYFLINAIHDEFIPVP